MSDRRTHGHKILHKDRFSRGKGKFHAVSFLPPQEMPDDEYPLIDPYDIRETLQHDVDLVIDGGYCGMEATTVVDLVDETPLVLRAGKGDIAPFEN